MLIKNLYLVEGVGFYLVKGVGFYLVKGFTTIRAKPLQGFTCKKNQQGLFLLIMYACAFFAHELLQFVNVGLR